METTVKTYYGMEGVCTCRIKIQVIIADDNKEFSEILSEYLNNQGDIEVIGTAKDGNEACELIAEKCPI